MRIFLAGDSTMQFNDSTTYPQTGWGQVLPLFFKPTTEFFNHAKNGRSTKNFIDEGRFAAIEAQLAPGDSLFIQFGHNDEKDDPARHTDPETTFRENLVFFAQRARSRGSCPVFFTPVSRCLFEADGSVSDTHGAYPEAMRECGRLLQVPVIDLTILTAEYLSGRLC
jgi:lysophospholipase L1-like esterase